MDRFINHGKLGKVEILMSFQRIEDGISLPKVVALAKCTTRPVESTSWSNLGEISYKRSYNSRTGKLVEQYYLVWGTDDNFYDAGFRHLSTPSGRKVSFKSALKIFNDAIKATEFVNFSKI